MVDLVEEAAAKIQKDALPQKPEYNLSPVIL